MATKIADCAWTGGYFTDPTLRLNGSYSSWGAFSESACATSGVSEANWKDCASSIASRTLNGFAVATEINYGGAGLIIGNGVSVSQLPSPFNNNIASSL